MQLPVRVIRCSLAHCTRVCGRFERPERKMVAEHVQPTPGSQTALNQQLGIRDGRDYQAMGITR
ncbi:hypothetical protein BaRGS_00023599, partial [Batillaria attramentaria]